MRKRVTLICLIATLCSSSRAWGGAAVEVVQPRGLLLLGGVRQWASLVYDYNGHDSGDTGSSSHQFKEAYHFGTDVALIDPHLLNIQLDSDVWLVQSRFSNDDGVSRSSNELQFQYSLAAVAFDRAPYPIVITSSRTQATVTGTFTPSYTTTSTGNGVMASLLNRIVPLRFRYQRTTLDTDGLTRDSSTTTDNISLNATNSFRDISHTELNVAFGSQQVASGLAGSDSSAVSLVLSNGLKLDKEKRYTLSTTLQWQDSLLSQNGTAIPQQTADFTEALACRFGGALQGGATYQYSFNKTLGFNDREQVMKANQFTVFLSHRLFRNLETRISGQARVSEILGGNESLYGGTAAVSYRRSLPAESELTLGFGGSHLVTDRDLAASTLIVRDEEHLAGQQGESIPLKVTGTQTVVVRIISHNPEMTYTEGTDYLVDFPAAGSIFIVPGGTIAPGTVLFITYSIDLSPSVKYSTDTVSASGSLSLFRNRYRIFGNILEQSQSLISGRATDSSLPATRTAMIHADANYPANVLSLEYVRYSSGATGYSYVEGGWRFDRRFPLSGFTLRIRDRYTTYDALASGSRGYSENTFDIGGSYSRSLFSWARAQVQLNLVDVRGGELSRDYAYFRTSLQGRINSLLLTLAGQTIWRLTGSQSTRDDSVHVEITRYF